MTDAPLSPLTKILQALLQHEKSVEPELVIKHLQEICELFIALQKSTPLAFDNALKELRTNFQYVTVTLLNFKDRLNSMFNARIDWKPAQESDQEHSRTADFRWAPTEIFASKEVLVKYLELLVQAGVTIDPKTVTGWLSSVPRAKDVIEIGTETFEEALKSAAFDEKKALEFEKSPPELTFKTKMFLADALKIRRKPRQSRVTHAHMLNSLQLKGATVSARVKNLIEKYKEPLEAIDSEAMACLVLGKILGFEWEINVNNAELLIILQDARNELKFSTVPRELLAQYDQILIRSGISKNILIKIFGINPKDIK